MSECPCYTPMSAEEDLPEDPTSPADEPGLPPDNSELPPTPLEVVIPLIRELELSQIETKKWFLRQFTQMLRDHNQMMQQQMSFQQQLTEISRRCQILQDWMMSPVRMVPLQVLQDNTLNIDQLQDAISQTPSDNDPWSVQLLELLDHSIAAHFPHFDFSTLGSFEPRDTTVIPRKSFRGTRSLFDSRLYVTSQRKTGRAKICPWTCSIYVSKTGSRGWNSLPITSACSGGRWNSVSFTAARTSTQPRCVLPSHYATRWRRSYSFSNLWPFFKCCCF